MERAHRVRSRIIASLAARHELGAPKAGLPHAGTRQADTFASESGRFFSALRFRSGDGTYEEDPVFVAILEIARFEAIRRNVGYATGIAILDYLAAALRSRIDYREIGRQNRASIEFSFAAASSQAAMAALLGLCDMLSQPIEVDGCVFELAIRIGFARFSGQLAPEELIDRIDFALWDKRYAHETVVEADTRLESDTAHRLTLLKELQRAISNDRLDLHYQPKLRCRTGTVTSAEALLRWHHPKLGAVRPDEIVGLAEETEVIGALTDWVLRRAVADQRRLTAAGHAVSIDVNISGQLLPDRRFAARALAIVGGSAGLIGFEITETAVIADPERAIANLRAFADAGIRVAIDDYGSGLSSLAYLKQLPAHELKIDRQFISGLTSSHRDPLLVRSSIDLAHALEMEVTAEGVDSPMAMSLLDVMGCDMIQGYLVSEPLPFDRLVAFLARTDHAAHIKTSAKPLHLFARTR